MGIREELKTLDMNKTRKMKIDIQELRKEWWLRFIITVNGKPKIDFLIRTENNIHKMITTPKKLKEIPWTIVNLNEPLLDEDFKKDFYPISKPLFKNDIYNLEKFIDSKSLYGFFGLRESYRYCELQSKLQFLIKQLIKEKCKK